MFNDKKREGRVREKIDGKGVRKRGGVGKESYEKREKRTEDRHVVWWQMRLVADPNPFNERCG